MMNHTMIHLGPPAAEEGPESGIQAAWLGYFAGGAPGDHGPVELEDGMYSSIEPGIDDHGQAYNAGEIEAVETNDANDGPLAWSEYDAGHMIQYRIGTDHADKMIVLTMINDPGAGDCTLYLYTGQGSDWQMIEPEPMDGSTQYIIDEYVWNEDGESYNWSVMVDGSGDLFLSAEKYSAGLAIRYVKLELYDPPPRKFTISGCTDVDSNESVCNGVYVFSYGASGWSLESKPEGGAPDAGLDYTMGVWMVQLAEYGYYTRDGDFTSDLRRALPDDDYDLDGGQAGMANGPFVLESL